MAVRSAAFVGRTSELAALVAAFEAAVHGCGGTVLVGGEAGMGKSRLVAELADRVEASEAIVLRGRCVDLVGQVVPYLALTEAFRPGGDDPPGSNHPTGQITVHEALRVRLEKLAAAAPVLLLIEDLHWADASTLDVVALLTGAVRRLRVLMVATYRSDEVPTGTPFHRALGELWRAPSVQVVRVPPLAPSDLDALLRAHGSGLPDEVIDAIIDRSGGNPFFAEELLAAAGNGQSDLPDLLRDALLRRYSGLDTAARSAVVVAAAVGRDAAYRLLAAALPLPVPALHEALRQAVDHGILVADQASATYRFRHALLAEAVYGTLIPGEREELHARLATALAADVDVGGAGEQAQHWALAGRPAEALAASVRAAREAEAAYGLSEALGDLERAVELWPRVPAADELTGADLPGLLAQAAELADLTGNGPAAARYVRRAIQLVEVEDAARAGLLYERLGSYLLPAGDRVAGLAACHRAVDLVPDLPATMARARVLTTLGNALMLSGRHAESVPACRAALATAQALGDGRPALRARGVLGIDLCYLGHPEHGLPHVFGARRLALDAGSARDRVHSYALVCEALMVVGRPADAAREAIEGVALARRLGVVPSFGALLSAYAAEGLLEIGDWARAEDLLDGALRPGLRFWSHYPRLLRAQLAMGRGDLAEAERHLEAGSHAVQEPTSATRYRRLAAELALWRGQPDAALAAVEEGLAAADTAIVHRVRYAALGLWAYAEQVVLAALRRDQATVDTARARADVLLADAGRASGLAAAVTPDATAWQAVADAEWSRVAGRCDPGRWSLAAAAWQKLARPYPAAYCLWRHAEALLGAHRRMPEVARAARDAYRAADRLGALRLRHEVELLARRGRLDLVEPPRPRPGGADLADLGLTGRELEVLDLLVLGYSNGDIAVELTISIKTASVHVTNILRKLGVARRTEAAAIAQRLAAKAPVGEI
jgi:DNA-binding CsgD family transcriptional regulator/tetratricopeptide (TPR) repeat protein